MSAQPGAALVVAAFTLAVAAPAAAASLAYVVNHGDNDVSVIDTSTSQVVTTVDVGQQPLGAAVNPAATRTYVTNQVTPVGTVSVVDTATNSVLTAITVGGGPSGVAFKLPGDRAYVTNRDDKTVSVIDTTALTVDTVTVGNNPLGVAVNPAGTPAYVVNKGSNTVSVIDTTTDLVIDTIPVGNDPAHVAVSPDGRFVYVTNNSNASVSVIDTATDGVVTTVPVGAQPEGIAVDPSGERVYVANSGPGNVSVIDTASDTVIKTIDVGDTPFELAVTQDGARVYVANRGGGTVSVIDTTTQAVADTVPVGFAPAGYGQFIAPALAVPRFVKVARGCQLALAHQATKLAIHAHALEVDCQLGLVKAEVAGGGTAAEAACLAALDETNPTSKLSRARIRAVNAVARRCPSVTPRQINSPCTRAALTIGDTIGCLLDQHLQRVADLTHEEFSATRPVLVTLRARACQTAIAKAGRRFADRLQNDFATCLGGELVAADAGVGEARAKTKCAALLDPAIPTSIATRVRAAAVGRIAVRCRGLSPGDLGSPCDSQAANLEATASCIFDTHQDRVGKMIAAEFNDACTILTRIGLAPSYLSVCSGA